ncbi:hypothetical protein NKR19_g6566 [Coniochaeta hoffmannii]|uniref:Uncharacterized protein n=1 Tax=Coniochaeta hoffmannii TaxID=91930 RepID=A0AA38RF09_9PEZI|nr:hypothetical protein NKR19_g6566 [Coniochaeta hoffmannii]
MASTNDDTSGVPSTPAPQRHQTATISTYPPATPSLRIRNQAGVMTGFPIVTPSMRLARQQSCGGNTTTPGPYPQTPSRGTASTALLPTAPPPPPSTLSRPLRGILKTGGTPATARRPGLFNTPAVRQPGTPASSRPSQHHRGIFNTPAMRGHRRAPFAPVAEDDGSGEGTPTRLPGAYSEVAQGPIARLSSRGGNIGMGAGAVAGDACGSSVGSAGSTRCGRGEGSGAQH